MPGRSAWRPIPATPRRFASGCIAGGHRADVDQPHSPPYIGPQHRRARKASDALGQQYGGRRPQQWRRSLGAGAAGRRRRAKAGRHPSLEDILNRGRDRFRGTLAGRPLGDRRRCRRAVVFWLYNSVYTIAPQEVGVETTFGVPSNELETQGLHFLFWPFQAVERVNITQNKTDIGSVTGGVDAARTKA